MGENLLKNLWIETRYISMQNSNQDLTNRWGRYDRYTYANDSEHDAI